MAATTLPPPGGNGNGLVPVILTVEPTIAALLVGADHEHGLVTVALAQNRRASLSMGVESALALARQLVGAVADLGRGGGLRK
jgi:hypothetical protein